MTPEFDIDLVRLQRAVDAATSDQTPPRYFVAVFPDGGSVRVMGFSTVERLARWMKKNDGMDGFIVPFAGHALGFTEGPNRRLLLPDGRAVNIHDERIETLDDDVELTTQTDWFFGPESLRPPHGEPP